MVKIESGQTEKDEQVQKQESLAEDTFTRANECDDMWFMIQRPSSSTPFTYQEVMVFSKVIATFEDKKYQSQMILWLLLQFPLNNLHHMRFTKHIRRILQKRSNSTQNKEDGEGTGLRKVESDEESSEDDESGQ